MIVLQLKSMRADRLFAERQPDSASRRRGLGLATVVLAVVTALVLARFAAVLGSPAVSPAAESEIAALIHRYYAAVNTAIATGETGSLATLVADDLRLPAGIGGAEAGREALTRRLLALHANRPEVRLVPLGLVAGGDTAVVRIALAGSATGLALPTPTGAAADEWIDGFQVEAGKVSEVWGLTPTLAAPVAVIDAEQMPPAGEVFFGLARLRLEPAADVVVLTSPGPLVVVAESGPLWARADGVGALTRTVGGEMTVGATPRGVPQELGPADQLSVPTGVPVGLRNVGAAPSTVLVAALLPMSSFDPITFSSTGWTPRSLAVALFERNRTGDAAADLGWPRGVSGEKLVGRLVPLPAGRLAMSVDRVTLVPDARILAFEAPGATLLAVEQGLVVLEAAPPAADEARPEATLLATGEAAALEANRPVTVRALGGESTTQLVIALTEGDRG